MMLGTTSSVPVWIIVNLIVLDVIVALIVLGVWGPWRRRI